MKIGQNNKTVQAQKLIQTRGSDIDNWVKYFILQPILLILVQGVNKNRLNISCPKIEEINQLGGQQHLLKILLSKTTVCISFPKKFDQ